MSCLDYLKRLYSLDTLDTRFTTSGKLPPRVSGEDPSIADSKLPAQQTLGSANGHGKHAPLPGAQPSRWRTTEFYFYYLCFLTIPFLMVKAVYDVSKGAYPVYRKPRATLN